MLSAVVGRLQTGSTLVIQHRDELVAQNRDTFRKVNPKIRTDLMVANRKNFLTEGCTFAMVQTLARNLDSMRPIDALAIDECHHVAAESYQKIINRARELNPDLILFGVTATPMRADKRALTGAFTNVADVISITELIQSGHLVRPRTFVIDCGLRDELKGVRRTAADFDMGEVEKIMDKSPVTDRVIAEWQKLAGDRRTIVFASTVEHAQHVTDAFKAVGVKAELVHGNMGEGDRKAALARLDRGETQVVCNVAVLTEGFDCQPVACVILLRPCSHKSTMLQMIGRGLRKVDQQRYPGIRKDDCIVIDFGYSLITHGTLETDIELAPVKGEGGMKINCPSCRTEIPANVRECPVCGEIINEPDADGRGEEREALVEFALTEIELIEASPFRWEPFFDGAVTIANGLTAWAAVLNYNGRWLSVCGDEAAGTPPVIVADEADKVLALSSADDFLREHGDRSNARKSRSWLSMPPSDKQLNILGIAPLTPAAFSMNRYRASCALTWRFCEGRIRSAVERSYRRAA